MNKGVLGEIMNEVKASMIKLPKKIEVVGRRWFQKSTGNTYHSCEIFVDDEKITKIPFKYGYGHQFLYTAWDYLEKQGIVPERERKNEESGGESPWVWAARNRVELAYFADNVKRKKDL